VKSAVFRARNPAGCTNYWGYGPGKYFILEDASEELGILLQPFRPGLELLRVQRDLVLLKQDSSAQHVHFHLEVRHHICEERVDDLVQFLVVDLVNFNTLLQQVAATDGQTEHGRNFRSLQIRHLAVQDVGRLGQHTGNLAVRHKSYGRTLANCASNQLAQHDFCNLARPHDVIDERPGARRGKRMRRVRRIEHIQALRRKVQVTNDVGVNVVVNGPIHPAVKIGTQLQMDEAVGERRGHTSGDAAIAFTVTGGHDCHVGGQLIARPRFTV